MSIDLTTKFLPYVDEVFTTESKKSLLTNQDFDWSSAHSVKIYKVSTSSMNDYNRAGTGTSYSRYGNVAGLDATTEELTLKKDRSFTFTIDKLDRDETQQQLAGATALSRQTREVVVPEVDIYTYSVMANNAGTKPAALELTAANIYGEILKGSEALDDAEVPEAGRILLAIPTVYTLMKKSTEIIMETDIAEDMRKKGVIGILDGMSVIKIPAKRMPADFGFMIAHPCATVAPAKLEDYKVHEDPPGVSGSLVEGRIVYDAFVLDNKAKAIYYQASGIIVASAAGSSSGKTAITVSPTKATGNSYKYKTAASVAIPAHGSVAGSDYTAWNGTDNITATTGDDIVIVEVDSNNKIAKAGKATVTSKA